jgi:APA family basic amino acid/polyamine antiporter
LHRKAGAAQNEGRKGKGDRGAHGFYGLCIDTEERLVKESPSLKREIGLIGTVLLGLGSMLGSGVFVSIALAEAMVGAWVLAAILLAAALAGCNALSSAQLAASHQRAGGTYEYGHVYVSPAAGFLAGVAFLTAKGASAATAALAFAAFCDALAPAALPRVPVAIALVAVLTGLVLAGLRRANRLNAAIVGFVMIVLIVLIVLITSASLAPGAAPNFSSDIAAPATFLHASALLFVAFTGYGRVATLAEEVRDPARTIPPAIGATIIVTSLLYLGIGWALVRVPLGETEAATVLEAAALALGSQGLALAVALAALVAMVGVLLNLLLGLSRVLLAMGRRGDAPTVLAGMRGDQPDAAIVVVGIGVAGLCLIGDVRIAWTFSAVSVLIYYAVTNLAALRLAPEHRLFPRWVSWAGLGGCLGLAAFIPPRYWLWMGLVLAIAFALRHIQRRSPSA